MSPSGTRCGARTFRIGAARVFAEASNPGAVEVALRALVYDRNDALSAVDGDAVRLAPGTETVLGWRIPDTGGQPIQSIGIALRSQAAGASGAVRLDYLTWDGAPELRLRRPDETSDFWRRSWVNGVSFLSKTFPQAFRISQDREEGLLIHGTRQWTDYRLAATVTVPGSTPLPSFKSSKYFKGSLQVTTLAP